MIDGRFDLSGDEIRELLREPEGESAPVPEIRSCSVLLLSKRPEETDLLKGRLEAAGAKVTAGRNPFTALDQIRRMPFDGIVSDLDLWANDGSLLLERVSGTRTLVLFVSREPMATAGELEKRLRDRGAWRVLFHPLDPRDVEGAAQALVAMARGSTEAPAPAAEAKAAQGQDARAAGPQTGERPRIGDEVAGELAWLRFLCEAQRTLRAAPGREARLKELLEIGLKVLGATGAGLFHTEGGEPGALLVSRSQEDGAIFEKIIALRREPRATAESLTIHFGRPGEGCCQVFLGLPPSVVTAFPSFAEDVSYVLDLVLSA